MKQVNDNFQCKRMTVPYVSLMIDDDDVVDDEDDVEELFLQYG